MPTSVITKAILKSLFSPPLKRVGGVFSDGFCPEYTVQREDLTSKLRRKRQVSLRGLYPADLTAKTGA